MSAIRVLWLIKGLGPGGAEQLLVNQAGAADHDRFRYSAAYLVPWKNHHVAALRATGMDVVCLEGARNQDPRWAARLRAHLLRHPVDVVHVHSPLVAAVTRLVVRTLPRHGRPGLVYTEHNRWPRHSRYTRALNRATFSLDDAQLSVSADVRDTIPPRLRPQVEVLVHGIDLDAGRAAVRHRDDVRAELGIAPHEVVIGVVANFRKEKAYPDLLEAARMALASGVPLRFVSVGQGPLEAEVRALHQSMGLGDRFLLLGYRDDAVRVMSAFDVFTLSSLHEGLPVSLMDALALGLPVAATEVGGVAETVTHGREGLLSPPADPAALAASYVALASDPAQRTRMGAAAALLAERFDIAAATERLEEIYADVAARRRPVPATRRSSRS